MHMIVEKSSLAFRKLAVAVVSRCPARTEGLCDADAGCPSSVHVNVDLTHPSPP